MPKFYNKDGSLTAYAFACGYIQQKNGVKLYKDGCFHVRTKGFWESFDKLTPARKCYKSLVKKNED